MTRVQNLFLDRVPTPIGAVLVVADSVGVLRALDFEDRASRTHRFLRIQYGNVPLTARAAPPDVKTHLRRYFEGELHALSSILWSTAGTAFQHTVWRALTKIAPGVTMTYGALARTLGNPAASRAVGLANGANPISLVVPCHRVIGADGALTGYGGGLHRKRWLLQHEGIQLLA